MNRNTIGEQQISDKEQKHNGWNNTFQSRNRETMGGTTHIRVGTKTQWVEEHISEQEYEQVSKHIKEQEQEHNRQNKKYQRRNRNTMGGEKHIKVEIRKWVEEHIAE